MLEKGSYESTSVKDIAQRADMAAGLIHHYFKSKDEILMLVARMLFESIRNDIDELYLARDEAGKREQLHELVGQLRPEPLRHDALFPLPLDARG